MTDRRYAEWERHIRPCIDATARWYAKNAAWIAAQGEAR